MEETMIDQPYIHDYEEKIGQSKRGFYTFLAVLFGTATLAGSSHLLYHGKYVILMQLVTFLILGFVYLYVMHKKQTIIEKKEAFRYALTIGTAIFLTLLLLSFLVEGFSFGNLLAFTCAFLAPAAVAESWRLFVTIPDTEKAAWTYSNDIPEQPIFVYLDKKPLRMKMLIGDEKPIEIPSTAPTSLKLGTAFYYIARELGDAQVAGRYFMDEQQQPFGWVFYKERYGLWKEYLNPEDTLLENNIKANDVIVAKRLR